MLVQLLRAIARSDISGRFILAAVLELKRGLRCDPKAPEHRVAHKPIERIFAALSDLCLGRVDQNPQDELVCHKFAIGSLSANALAWLRKHRVPTFQFGSGALCCEAQGSSAMVEACFGTASDEAACGSTDQVSAGCISTLCVQSDKPECAILEGCMAVLKPLQSKPPSSQGESALMHGSASHVADVQNHSLLAAAG